MVVLGLWLLTVAVVLALLVNIGRQLFENRLEYKPLGRLRLLRALCLCGLACFCVGTVVLPTPAHGLYVAVLLMLLCVFVVGTLFRERARVRRAARAVYTLAAWTPPSPALAAHQALAHALDSLGAAAKSGEVVNQRAKALVLPMLAPAATPESTLHYLEPILAYRDNLERTTVAGTVVQSTVKAAERYDGVIRQFVLLWSSDQIPPQMRPEARSIIQELIENRPSADLHDLEQRVMAMMPVLLRHVHGITVEQLVETGDALEDGRDMWEKVIAPALQHTKHVVPDLITMLSDNPALGQLIAGSPLASLVVVSPSQHDGSSLVGSHHLDGHTTSTFDAANGWGDLGSSSGAAGYDYQDVDSAYAASGTDGGDIGGGEVVGEILATIGYSQIVIQEINLWRQGKKTFQEAIVHGGIDFMGKHADALLWGAAMVHAPFLLPVVWFLRKEHISFRGLARGMKRGDLVRYETELRAAQERLDSELLELSREVYQGVGVEVQAVFTSYEASRVSPIAWHDMAEEAARQVSADLARTLVQAVTIASEQVRLALVYSEPGWWRAPSRFLLGVPTDLFAVSATLGARLDALSRAIPTIDQVSAAPMDALARMGAVIDQIPDTAAETPAVLPALNTTAHALQVAYQSLAARVQAHNQLTLTRYLTASTQAADRINDRLLPFMTKAVPHLQDVQSWAQRVESERAKLGEG